MKTTALFVELLVIGAIASIWIALFIIKGFNQPEFDRVYCFISGNKFIMTAIAIPVVYTIGIIFDKMAKYIFLICDVFMTNVILGKRKLDHFHQILEPFWLEKWQPKMEIERYADIIVNKGDPMTDLLYGRTKVRILRALVVSLPFITWALSTFLANGLACQIGIPKSLLEIYQVAIVGGILCILSIFLYFYNSYLYRLRLNSFADSLKNSKNQKHP